MSENSKKLDKEYGNIAIDYVKHVCDTFGERPSGSKEEHKAAEDLKEKLGNFSDETFLDRFTAIPGLYPQGLIKLMAISELIGFIFFPTYFPLNILSLVFMLLGVFILFVSLVLMKEWFGLKIFGFKHKKSQNVFGKILPRDNSGNSKPGKKKIIIGGHMDSAFQMKIVKYDDNIARITFIAFGYVGITFILSLIRTIILIFTDAIVILKGSFYWITWVDIVWFLVSIPGLPFLIFIVYCYTGKVKVMGANDNLIGIGLAYAIGKYFTKNENRLKNVELWVGTFGAEECGERGSNAFVKKYGDLGELENAYAVVPESCGNGSHLAILTGERMHLATHHPEVYNKLWEAYKKTETEYGSENIIPCDVVKLPFAASDAGRFSLAGYKASTILAYDGKIMKPTNWHATTDTYDNLDSTFSQTVFEILKNYILLVEEENSN